MKKLLSLLLLVVITSCTTGNHKDFMANTELAKTYFNLHQQENAEAMWDFIHPDIEWHMPEYGAPMAGLEVVKQAVTGYHAEFEGMNFAADYWLPGVDPETGLPDGSTRTYGTWTAVHTATGQKVSITSYHAFSFKDGKIVGGGDWFDLGGMLNAIKKGAQMQADQQESGEES